MGYHLRRRIREAIGTAVTGLTTTGSRVYQSRVYPLQDANLPALLVFSKSERVIVSTMGMPRVLQRTVEIEVSAVAKATVDLDDALDGICKEVEVALAMPVSALAGLCETITLTATDIEMTGTADQPIGQARMTFEVEYFAAENAPDVAL
jgi:hypothetical protein